MTVSQRGSRRVDSWYGQEYTRRSRLCETERDGNGGGGGGKGRRQREKEVEGERVQGT